VNRNKTKKWVDAAKPSYGDDWGDEDEFTDVPPVPSATAGGRNFTTPQQLNRVPSFEKGDERRTFSAGTMPPSQMPAESSSISALKVRASRGASIGTNASEAESLNPEHRKDFEPAALPAPLHTASASRSNVSLSMQSPDATSPRSPSSGVYDPREAASTAAPKPFIRPADIYKRMQEAREEQMRASSDSLPLGEDHGARPLPVSTPLNSEKLHEPTLHGKSPLTSVQNTAALQNTTIVKEEPQRLEPIPHLEPPAAHQSTLSPSNGPHDGIRNLVDHAFHGQGISKQDSTRSHATSAGTSDISPILPPIQEIGSKEQAPTHPLAAEQSSLDHKDLPAMPPQDEFSDLENIYPYFYEEKNVEPEPLKAVTIPRSESPSKEKAVDTVHELDAQPQRVPLGSVIAKKSVPESKALENSSSTSDDFEPGASLLATRSHGSGIESPKTPDLSAPLPPPPLEFASLRETDSKPSVLPGLAAGAATVETGAVLASHLKKGSAENGHAEKLHAPIETEHRSLSPIYSEPVFPSSPPKPPAKDSVVMPSDTQFAQDVLPPPKDDHKPSELKHLEPEMKPKLLSPSVTEAIPPIPEASSSTNWLRDEMDKSLDSSTNLVHPESLVPAPISPVSPVLKDGSSKAPKLKKRFSWEETDSEDEETPEQAASSNTGKGKEAELPERPSLTQEKSNSTVDNPRFVGEGMHVINAQPGELPPEATDPLFNLPRNNDDQPVSPIESTEDHEGRRASLEPSLPSAITPSSPTSLIPETRAILPNVPAGGKLLSFREILTIQDPAQRVATYDSTRQQWANMNSGLDGWMSQLLQVHPEHDHVKTDPRPVPTYSIGTRPGRTFSDATPAGDYNAGRDSRTSRAATQATQVMATQAVKVGESLKGLGGKGKGYLKGLQKQLRGSGEGVGN
jgi:hypothetical protein